MATYRVQLTVEMDALTPENAVEMVASMADGWSYTAQDMRDDSKTTVHLEYGKPVESYPTPDFGERDPYEVYGTEEHEMLLIEEERGR